MLRKTRLGYQIGLIGFARVTTLARLVPRLASISWRRAARLLVLVLGSILPAPLRAWEWLCHERRIRATAITEAPIFIIGHWRSGTTHLHNLMSMDPRLGALRMFQTLSPDCSVSTRGWLPGLLGRIVPRKRPMDEMDWPMDAPQEEEIALAKMTPYSWYLAFLFPRQAVASFDRFVLFDGAHAGANARIAREVEACLLRIYRIATLHECGRRLLLKNPVNTCRIPLLLRLFPDAKFIFIHRSPHEVFHSTLHLHRQILDLTALQETSDADIEANVIALHQRVTATYLRDRILIPAGNLVEVAFAALTATPEATLREIYTQLQLPGYDDAQLPMAAHLAAKRNYQRNSFAKAHDKQQLVESVWRHDFSVWGYACATQDGAPAGEPQLPHKSSTA